ncbi:methionine/alanine import family NSS transporter small subunit [Cryobacterium sp. Hb1]|uniref:methionine/alanine import family NSS transporter small subunit n=1 Tax=Cryobacterium sp. Hb1 TaxID=1259147 RepID=UPI001069460D|nr:methionine/alanine import family NSS transporter small subunit [Cryobacterium sp. Hb1]TFD72928.1 methionine/alanine import family NSS transporter small subunit [Cryobacterium sp. Hb1]
MSASAIVMMIVALLAVWGGLGLALLNLKRHPEAIDDEEADAVLRDGASVTPVR